MGWVTGWHPDDRDGLREPFAFAGGVDPDRTPVRSPWALLAIALVVQLVMLVAAVMSIRGYLADSSPDRPLWLPLLGTSLVLLPVPLVWVGIVRVRWLLRYRRATGQSPIIVRDRDR